ncbi:MAG: twin-arginine translocase subunit TatC, partial [Brevinematia bacterium]
MEEKELTYWDHLEEFRRRVLFCIFVILFFSIISFFLLDKLLFFLTRPLSVYGIKLNYFKPYEKFFLYLKLSYDKSQILSTPKKYSSCFYNEIRKI